MFSCGYSKSFRDSFLYRTTLVAAFEVSFSITKEFLKKKVNVKLAFALISLFRVQIQDFASRSSTTRAFVFLSKFAEFIIIKYLTQEVDGNLSVCVDERSPCGLPITGGIEIYQRDMIKR